MTLKSEPEFKRMAELIGARCGGGPVVLISNPGNLGDALILAGATAFLQHFGFNFRVVRGLDVAEISRIQTRRAYLRRLLSGRSMLDGNRQTIRKLARDFPNAIYCGGGYWLPHSRKPAVIRRLLDGFEQLVVMPGTYAMPVPEELRSRALLFVRDRAQSQQYLPHAPFCHDTAFFLDLPKTEGVGVGWFMRGDDESSNALRPPSHNRDVSEEGDEWSDPEVIFDAVRPYSTVVTDRLHVAIPATLMGKQVFAFSSNYFKIPAIYESSIEGFYSNMSLVKSIDDLPHDIQMSY